jgi:ankyrin repeat protein
VPVSCLKSGFAVFKPVRKGAFVCLQSITKSIVLFGFLLSSFSFTGCVSSLVPAIASGDTARVSQMLDAGADVNAKLTHNELGNTLNASPVLFAALRGQTDVVKLLIEKGARAANSGVDVKVDVLLTASMYGNTETVRWVLDQGTDIHSCSGDGGTALILSAKKGHSACVSLLLSRGADAGRMDNAGKDAYQYACERSDFNMVSLIMASGDQQTAAALKGFTIEQLLVADEQWKGRFFLGGWTDRLIEAKNTQLPGFIAQSTVEQRIAMLNTVEKKLMKYQTELATMNSAAEDAVRKGQNVSAYRKSAARIQAFMSVLLEIKNMLTQS